VIKEPTKMIIGVAGLAGSGKDTLADILVCDYRFVRIGMADPLKRFCREVLDFSVEQLWGSSERRNEPDSRYLNEKNGYLTPRHALQRLGAEWGRQECYENVWVDYAIRMADSILEGEGAYHPEFGLDRDISPLVPPAGVVIPDIRYINEIRAVHAKGMVVKIVRPGVGVQWQHSSETELGTVRDDQFDYLFHNDGGIDEIPAKVQEMMECLT